MNDTVILECMHGLGDNVYQRVVARACLMQGWNLYVRTVWPQLWWDLPVHLLRAETGLRTQKENVDKYDGAWSRIPEVGYDRKRPHYGTSHFAKGLSIPSALLDTSGFTAGPTDFTYKPKAEWVEWARSIKPKDRPLAIVHPGTVRTEWVNSARPPSSAHFQTLIDAYPQYEWWEIGYVHPPQEVLSDKPLRGVARSLMDGQLSTEQLFGLMAVADVIVTCVGFMLPLGIALRTPTLCIYGGDIPDRLLVEPWMLGAPYRAVQPEPFCECGLTKRHENNECNKDIKPEVLVTAFREMLLEWRGDHGYYPVHVNGQYGKAYFEKYEGYARTPMGKALNDFRVDFVTRHFGLQNLVDVGPGACTFVQETGALGYDINPYTNARLVQLGKYLDPAEPTKVEVMTFWDSLEHIPNPKEVLQRATRGVAVSIPIFTDVEHVKRSKHFRPDEHIWYYTHEGFIRFMEEAGFKLKTWCRTESELGREDINTYAFER